jgi:purine-binding chemotaxis protein CheW
MGVMADSVCEVIDLKPQDIEEPPTFGTHIKLDYLLGMARSGKKFCLILDTENVLSTDDLLELSDSVGETIENQQAELASVEATIASEPTPRVAEEATEEERTEAQSE